MKLFVISLLFFSSTVIASSLNLAIPQSAQSYQSDKFRAGDLDCSNAIGSATNVEFGVTGIISQEENPYNTDTFGINELKDVGVYGRIIIPLGAPKERINCNTLYQLELEKKRLEVQRLKEELRQLRELQFEN